MLGISLFIFGFRYPIFYNLAGGWFIGLAVSSWQVSREERKEYNKRKEDIENEIKRFNEKYNKRMEELRQKEQENDILNENTKLEK